MAIFLVVNVTYVQDDDRYNIYSNGYSEAITCQLITHS